MCLTYACFLFYMFHIYMNSENCQQHVVTRCGGPCVKFNTNVGLMVDQCHVGVSNSLAILCPREMAPDPLSKLVRRRKLLGMNCFRFSIMSVFIISFCLFVFLCFERKKAR